jgi:hypothetical protein
VGTKIVADQVSTHRATNENGPQVVNGQLLWTSASGITKADPHSFGGCFRRWWYETVGGLWVETTNAQRGGTELHSEVENRLMTGASLQSPLALAGGIYIPTPGTGLLIEHPIHFKTRDGVNIFGHVDLYNFRQQYIDSEGVLQQDPPWSFEVKDWKTTSSFQYAKSERELAENVQLNTYGKAGLLAWPDMEHGRFTHVYFLTKGRPQSKLVTIRRTRQEIETRWEYAESVVRSMGDIAKATSAEQVEPNRKSCEAYRGCPHQGYCSAYGAAKLDHLYTKIADDWNERTPPVGLLTSNPQLMNQQAPQAPAQQPDQRAQLAAEEAQMRATLAQQQAPQLNVAQALERIEKYGRGLPALGGEAAQAYAQCKNYQLSVGAGYSGTGNMAGVQLMHSGQVFQLLGELDAEAARASQPPQQPPQPQTIVQQYVQQQPAAPQQAPQGYQPAPVAYLPPDAPQSQPQLAAQQPQGYTLPQQTYAPAPGAQPGYGPTPSQQIQGAPNPMHYPDQAPQPVVQQAAPAPAEETKTTRRRGRPTKDKDTAPEATAAAAAPTPSPSSVGTPVTQAPPATASPSESASEIATHNQYLVLINARSLSTPTKSLAGYVDYINADLSKRYSVDSQGRPGLQDVRAVPKDSPLAFGGWKGAVREVVKKDPPPPGAYHLDTFMDDLNEAVADALRQIAEANPTAWEYVRAVRS